MYNLELWIKNGELCERPKRPDGAPMAERRLLHDSGMVKLESGPQGTRVSWVMFGPNWASLLFLTEFIKTCDCPITLCYFNGGWFEESVDSAVSATHRLETLIAKSDVRLSQRTFVVPFENSHRTMPETLKQAYLEQVIPEDKVVVCRINLDSRIHSVERVGENSALASIWGVVPVSYPCQTGHTYDKMVSQSYFRAVSEGKPIYDHVLAAMVKPNSEVHWLSYQRVIIPEKTASAGEARVKVICEGAPVAINLL
jgi:hypothetical protein